MPEEIKNTSTPEGTPILREIKALNIVWGAFGNGENDTGIVERIDKPETGGIFTKYVGCNYLFKGYPDIRIIEAIAIPKKIISRGIFLLSQRLFQFVVGFSVLPFLILPKSLKKKFIFSILDYFLAVSYAAIQKLILPPERYCVAVKEIGIAFTKTISGIKDIAVVQSLKTMRDIGCMMFEDYAYKARFQDVLPHLNKEWLKKNPRKEIGRIFDILISRDISCLLKWQKLKKILMFVLRFKELRDFIVRLLLEIDLDKIKPDEADWYFVLDRNDYNYGGLSYEERMKISAELDKKVGNHRPKIIFKEKTNVV